MPFFSQAPSSSLSASLKRAIGGSGGQLDPMQEIEIDAKAASTAQSLAMVDKLRAEVKAKQEEQQMRTDPARAAEYAGNVAGMDRPNSLRLAANLRGDTEQPSVADVEDAAIVGREAAPFRVTAPDVTPGQRNAFQRSLAAIGANLLATGHTNADQLIQGQGRLQDQDVAQRVQDAIAAGRMQDASAMNQGAKPGTAIKLFDNVGETGATFAPATGVVQADPAAQPGNSLLKGTLDKIKAAIGKDNAAAGASTAHAGLFNAQADKVRNPGTEAALGKPPAGYRWGEPDETGAPTMVPIAGGPAEKLGEAQMKQIAGVQSTRNAIAEYRAALKNWGKTDMLNPAARAKMGTIYNNMLLQAKEAYNLGVLNGPDYQILQEVVANPNNFKSGLISKEALDTQAAELDRLMKGIGITVDATGRQRTGGAPAAPAKSEATKVINGTTYVKVDGKWYQR